MEAKEVGRLGVRALPDTTNFRRDLLEKLKGIEKRARIQVKAVLDGKDLAREVDRTIKAVEKTARVTLRAVLDDDGLLAGARRASEKAQETARRNPVQVPVVSEMDKAFRSRISSDVRKAVSGVEALIPATVEGERLRSEIAAQVDRIQDQVKAEIPVEPEKAAAFRAKIAKMVSDVEDRAAKIRVDAETAAAKQRLEDLADEAEKRDIHLPVNVDAALAAARIAALTRDRLVTIRTRLEGSSFAATAGALAGLSGARVLGDLGSSVRNLVTNLDRSLPSVAGLTLAIATLSATALAGVSNLVALGGSLAAIVPAALALPGILAGFAVGTGVLIAALVDIKDVLGDLGPSFSALQDSISTAFWARAAQPIRDLANGVLPILQDKLTAISHEFGVMAAAIANTLNTPFGRGLLTKQLEYVRESVDIAGEGMAYLTQAVMSLGTTGASYLPRLAGWFNQITERFEQFVLVNTGNGNIFRWIDTGIRNLRDLGRLIANTSGILAGLSRAAANAGGASLGALADGLARVNAAINGPVWQGALTTVFAGAHAAMAALAPGVNALGDAFISLAPTLASIMVLAGQAASALLEGLGAALSSPALQSGATAMFAGILAGVRALQPAFPALGAAVGSLLGVLGALAATIGPVLGTAIQALAPAFMGLLAAVQPIIPVLGGALTSVVQALAPMLVAAADAVASFAQRFPGLSAVLVVVGAVVAAMVPLVVSLLGTLATIAPVISAVAGSFAAGGAAAGALSGVLSVLGAAVRVLLGPVGLIAGLFLAAVASSAPLREALASLGASVLDMVTTVGGQLGPVFSTLGQILAELASIVASVLTPVFERLAPLVSTAFSAITSVITASIAVIQAVLNTLLAFLQGDWSAVWSGLGSVVTAVWDLIVSVVEGALSILASAIDTKLATIGTSWSEIWNGLLTGLSGIWEGITAFITGAIASVQTAVATGLALIQTIWTTAWTGLTTGLAEIWVGLQTTVATGLMAVVTVITTVFAQITAVVQAAWSQVSFIFTGALAAIQTVLAAGWAIIQTIFTTALELIKTVVAGAFLAIVGLVTGNSTLIAQAVSAAWVQIQQIIIAAGAAILATLTAAWTSLVAITASTYATLVGHLSAAWATITSVVASAVASVWSAIQSAWASVVSGTVSAWNSITSAVSSALASVVSFVVSGIASVQSAWSSGMATVQSLAAAAWAAVTSLVVSAMAALVSAVVSGAANVVSSISSMGASIISTLSALPGQMVTIGTQMIQGLINGITSMAGAVAEKARSVVQGAIDAAKSALKIKSPSRVFMQIGNYTVAGLVKGLTGSQSKAEKAAGDMAKAIHQQYKKTFPDAKQFQRIVGVSREQGANNFLRNHVNTELGILERYAAQRDKLTDRLKASQRKLDEVMKDRNKYRDSLAETLAGGFSLSAAANGEIGLERITQSAQDALAQIRTLRSQISQLGKLGVPKGLIDEIAQLGGEKGSLVAEQLLKGPRSQLKELSKTYTAIQSESAKTAGTVADQMYGVGVDAAHGLVKGIESQLAAVDRASKTLADRLTKKVRTYLGIHSPSRVFMRIGEQTGDGMVLGLDHRVKAVQRSMAAMVAPPSPVAPERDGRLGGAGLPPINLTVPAREGEDPSRVGRRAGEALAFELGKWV